MPTLTDEQRRALRGESARRAPSRELTQAFAPKTVGARQQAAFGGKTSLEQAAASIRATSAAVSRIASQEGVDTAAAANILRETAIGLRRARAAFQGIASGLTKRGATQPLLLEEAVRKLTNPSSLRGVPRRKELARFVAEEEARRASTNIRVFRTEEERQRNLLRLRR